MNWGVPSNPEVPLPYLRVSRNTGHLKFTQDSTLQPNTCLKPSKPALLRWANDTWPQVFTSWLSSQSTCWELCKGLSYTHCTWGRSASSWLTNCLAPQAGRENEESGPPLFPTLSYSPAMALAPSLGWSLQGSVFALSSSLPTLVPWGLQYGLSTPNLKIQSAPKSKILVSCCCSKTFVFHMFRICMINC